MCLNRFASTILIVICSLIGFGCSQDDELLKNKKINGNVEASGDRAEASTSIKQSHSNAYELVNEADSDVISEIEEYDPILQQAIKNEFSKKKGEEKGTQLE